MPVRLSRQGKSQRPPGNQVLCMTKENPMGSETMNTTLYLSLDEQCCFETLIDDLIIAKYNGDLERWWDDRECRYHYTPVDTDDIRDLLTKLWGDLLSKEACDDAFLRLTEDGAEEWPHAYCEDEEAERTLPDCERRG